MVYKGMMLYKTKPELYYGRMDSAKDDKRKMLQFIHDREKVLDVGAGSGVVSRMVLDSFSSARVHAIDPCISAAEHFEDLVTGYPERFHFSTMDFLSMPEEQYDVIIFCSVIHEIFSYTVYEGQKFNLDIVDTVLRKAARMLKPEGRIIIRDGVAPTYNNKVLLRFKDEELKHLSARFENEFMGFPLEIKHTSLGLVMPRRSAMEMLYTITWGDGSFEREVQEWYGFYSLEDWRQQEQRLMVCQKTVLIHLEKYLQPGYTEHLEAKVDFMTAPKLGMDGQLRMRSAAYPASNCLVVFKKI